MARRTSQKEAGLGRKIRQLRRKAGLTQERLADKTRLSTTFIGLLETGKRKPSLKTLQKVASAVGVKAKELLPF